MSQNFMLRTLFVILACLLLINCDSSSISNPIEEEAIDDAEVQRLVAEALGYLEAHEFEKLSALFHYPPDYTTEEKTEDLCDIQFSLSSMIEYLGTPTQTQGMEGLLSYQSSYFAAGNQNYWLRHNLFKNDPIPSHVQFFKKGGGIILISIVNITDKYELGLLGYGLDSDKEGTGELRDIKIVLNNRSESRKNTNICSFTG